MNQHQRKFLLEAVEKQYRIEREALRARAPKEPSLNNYLTAAILDGSFVMRSAESVRSAITARVRDLGKGEALLSDRGRLTSWNRGGKDGEETHVTMPALLLFEEPPAYTVEREKYEAALAQWKAEEDALEASIGAMRIKVQIGSDRALEALVNQADQLCSMSLTTTNKLLLGNAVS